jgi:hypothetical protein
MKSLHKLKAILRKFFNNAEIVWDMKKLLEELIE